MSLSNGTRITQNSETLSVVTRGTKSAAQDIAVSASGLANAIPLTAFGLAGVGLASAGNDFASKISDTTKAIARYVDKISAASTSADKQFTAVEEEAAKRFKAIEEMLK